MMRTALFGLLLATSSACHAHPPFDLAQRALAGDLDAVHELARNHGDSSPTKILAAQGYRAAGDDARAIKLLEDAMRNGSQTALWARVVHHIEGHDWIEGYAWGRLAMLVEKHRAQARDEAITDDGWPMQWSWQFTQRAARNLRDADFPIADQRTEQVVQAWYELLTESREQRQDRAPSFVERRAPTYPRAQAQSRETGWTFLMLRFDSSGEVVEVLPVVHTHETFAERANAAVEDWIIEPSSLESNDFDRAFFQTVEFSLNP